MSPREVQSLQHYNEYLTDCSRIIDKPHVLDSHTVNRIITLYTEQAEDHWFFEARLKQWKNEGLPGF